MASDSRKIRKFLPNIPGDNLFFHQFKFDMSLPNPPLSYSKTLYYPLQQDRHYKPRLLASQLHQMQQLLTPCNLGIPVDEINMKPYLYYPQNNEQTELDPEDLELINEEIIIPDKEWDEILQKQQQQISESNQYQQMDEQQQVEDNKPIEENENLQNQMQKEDKERLTLGVVKLEINKGFKIATDIANTQSIVHPNNKDLVCKNVFPLLPIDNHLQNVQVSIINQSQFAEKYKRTYQSKKNPKLYMAGKDEDGRFDILKQYVQIHDKTFNNMEEYLDFKDDDDTQFTMENNVNFSYQKGQNEQNQKDFVIMFDEENQKCYYKPVNCVYLLKREHIASQQQQINDGSIVETGVKRRYACLQVAGKEEEEDKNDQDEQFGEEYEKIEKKINTDKNHNHRYQNEPSQSQEDSDYENNEDNIEQEELSIFSNEAKESQKSNTKEQDEDSKQQQIDDEEFSDQEKKNIKYSDSESNAKKAKSNNNKKVNIDNDEDEEEQQFQIKSNVVQQPQQQKQQSPQLNKASEQTETNIPEPQQQIQQQETNQLQQQQQKIQEEQKIKQVTQAHTNTNDDSDLEFSSESEEENK